LEGATRTFGDNFVFTCVHLVSCDWSVDEFQHLPHGFSFFLPEMMCASLVGHILKHTQHRIEVNTAREASSHRDHGYEANKSMQSMCIGLGGLPVDGDMEQIGLTPTSSRSTLTQSTTSFATAASIICRLRLSFCWGKCRRLHQLRLGHP
jgi:hypothetical protein